MGRKEELYSHLCQRMDALIEKYNPCHFYFEDDHFMCARGQSSDKENGCCGDCEYFANGCTIECLACKMWICREAFDFFSSQEQREWLREVRQIDKIRLKNKLGAYARTSKEKQFGILGEADDTDNLGSKWFIGEPPPEEEEKESDALDSKTDGRES